MEVIKLVAQGGFGMALLVLIAFVGRRMICAMDASRLASTAALDKLGDRVDANTRATTEVVSELRQDLAVLGARVEVWTSAAAPVRDRPSGSVAVVDPRLLPHDRHH